MLLRAFALCFALVCCPLAAAGQCPADASASAISLEPLRQLIDARLALMPDVARHKWNTHGAIDDLVREQQVVDALKARAQALGVPRPWAERFFRAQIDGAKQIQRARFAQWEQAGAGQFADVPDLVTVIRPRLDGLTADLLRALGEAWPALADPCQRARIAAAMAHLEHATPQAAATVTAPLLEAGVAPDSLP
ncbi:MAG: gamma subclass chorismate mutase AroQ [Pseudomonadota bacterium]